MTKKTSVYDISFNEIKAVYNRDYLGPSITCSHDIYDALRIGWPNIDFEERFYVLMMTRTNRVIGVYNCSIGSVSGTVCDPKKIFAVSLSANASCIAIAHNHPSGSLIPSSEDDNMTQKIIAASKFLEMTFHDHIIITSDGYYSYADNDRL